MASVTRNPDRRRLLPRHALRCLFSVAATAHETDANLVNEGIETGAARHGGAGAELDLLLANPPLTTPKPLRPIINVAARRIANRFVSTYRRHSDHPIDRDTFDWLRTLQACRILTDLAAWRADARQGHPWFSMEPALRPLLPR
jgi:hypothetical protein